MVEQPWVVCREAIVRPRVEPSHERYRFSSCYGSLEAVSGTRAFPGRGYRSERERIEMVKETQRLIEKDRCYVWHAMSGYDPSASPMIVEKGEGAWITDTDGNRYLDGMSGLWCVNVGYGREELARAVYEQLRQMSFYPLMKSHLPAIELGEKLNEW